MTCLSLSLDEDKWSRYCSALEESEDASLDCLELDLSFVGFLAYLISLVGQFTFANGAPHLLWKGRGRLAIAGALACVVSSTGAALLPSGHVSDGAFEVAA
eukprot:CAMPEP_0170478462 /NCGR_PEP_ID=MMETSP0123-20130129/19471_1 /TAXON_ID=182087 /ORGANISM="Favella ehrenbergii, Strain Fehren 1" /LENGTH=100 /DNA_ID=CAMNT_0010750713 /DNA_START=2211 /DNA_END=2513 /DNA_ORIENTATION=+